MKHINFKISRMSLCLSRLIFVMMMFVPSVMMAGINQQNSVSGVVKDENGEPLIGVNVIVKENPTIGTITDFDGNFILSVPSGGKKKTFNVIMSDDSQMLQEVQVIAYGTQKKVTITGALSSVGGEDLVKTPVASLGNALSGKMPGLSSVQYSGEPGADDPQIFIHWPVVIPLL